MLFSASQLENQMSKPQLWCFYMDKKKKKKYCFMLGCPKNVAVVCKGVLTTEHVFDLFFLSPDLGVLLDS